MKSYGAYSLRNMLFNLFINSIILNKNNSKNKKRAGDKPALLRKGEHQKRYKL